MKSFFSLVTLVLLFSSCSSLNSFTTIKPYDSFVLGNNEHGPFNVKMENTSKSELTIEQMKVGEQPGAPKTIAPNERISIKVLRNTAVVISNKTNNTASVNLKVSGDKGLSMQYKQ
jgi:hypothetical protein